MDVFIQEPLIDWMKNAKMTEEAPVVALPEAGKERTEASADASGSSNVPAADLNWYPARKIEIARLKLNLAHPSLLTCDELATGKLAGKRPFIDRAIDTVKGDPTDSIR